MTISLTFLQLREAAALKFTTYSGAIKNQVNKRDKWEAWAIILPNLDDDVDEATAGILEWTKREGCKKLIAQAVDPFSLSLSLHFVSGSRQMC